MKTIHKLDNEHYLKRMPQNQKEIKGPKLLKIEG